MKCDKCGYVSFDHNLECPECGKSLEKTRGILGIHLTPPEVSFDSFFLGDSSVGSLSQKSSSLGEAELDLDSDDTFIVLDEEGPSSREPELTWTLD